MSIRLRLSLLYSAILALTLVLFGIALYFIQAQYTLGWLKRDLVVSGDSLSQFILRTYLDRHPPDAEPKPGGVPQPEPPPPPMSPQIFSNNLAFQELSESEIVRVFTPTGTLIGNPFGGTETDLPLSATSQQAALQQREQWETTYLAGKRVLTYSRPIIFEGRVVSILLVARKLTERDETLQALGRTLVAAGLLTLLFAFGVGWILAGVTLQPIHRITRTAQAIGQERDFTRRVLYDGPQDEIGQLAITFNSMLAQLQEAYQKVARALEMQRNFVTDVSHELRTPLTTLRGNLGLLSRIPPIPVDEQADILKDMVDESDRLIRLVNDLLVLARADAGRNLNQERVLIRPILEEVCRQASQLAPQRSISMVASAEVVVSGDRDALKQVIIILVDNALKHTQGAIALTAEQQNSQVIIRVEDSGGGLPPEQLEHVFERFYRGDTSQVLTPGFGLGLPIAKALVEGQGGSICLHSEPGKGCLLVLSFPTAG